MQLDIWTERPSAPGVITIQMHMREYSDLIKEVNKLNIEHEFLHYDLLKDVREHLEANKRARVGIFIKDHIISLHSYIRHLKYCISE